MKPLVSIMIPSRKRVSTLIRTLTSIRDSASGKDYEVLIRIDEDDLESVAAVPQLMDFKLTTVLTGPRLGYAQLDSGYYAGLENQAWGDWVWIAGDDMIVEGDWMEELRKVPASGFIVQPEISRLGMSTYPRAQGQAFPIFPKYCWKQYSKTFPSPFDSAGDALLRSNGWKTWFLNGVTFWHDRPDEKEIEEHRK